jgi:hypothetical protein
LFYFQNCDNFEKNIIEGKMKKTILLCLVAFLACSYFASAAYDNLLAYWSFDDGTARDVTGNGYDGIMVNNPTVVPGVVGNAMHFQGKGYYIPINDDVAKIGSHILLSPINLHGLKEFSITMWVYHEGFSHSAGEAYFWFGHHHYGFLGIITTPFLGTPDPNYYVQMAVAGKNVTENIVYTQLIPQFKNNWVCYAMVYKNQTLYAYVNGILIDTLMARVNYSMSSFAISRHWWFYDGEERTSARFTGAIDEVKIYLKALSDEELLQECQACGPMSFAYNKFSQEPNLRLINNAKLVSDFLRLTSSAPNQVGAVWTSTPAPVGSGFETTFKFRITNGFNPDKTEQHFAGADGIAFVIQNFSPYALGTLGGGIGYDGIPNSIAVEFDTYANDSTQIENFLDPNDNHIAVLSNGTSANSSKHIKPYLLGETTNIMPLKTDGTIYYSKIVYDRNNRTLSVWLDTTEQFGEAVLKIENIEMSSILRLDAGELAFIGFTSATGNAYEAHEILGWRFCTYGYVLGVEEKGGKEATVVSPNPASGVVKLEFESQVEGIAELRVYDVYGKEVETKRILITNGKSEVEIDCTRFKPGVYVYKITTGKNILTGKFIKAE